MKYRVLLSAFSILILFSSIGFSQTDDTIQPNDEIINGSFIEPYTNQWKVSIIDTSGNKQHVRYWTDYAHILELDGVPYLHRVQDLYSPAYDLQETWINIVKHDDLTPLRFSLESTTGNLVQLKFGKNKITQRAYAEGEFKTEEIETDNQLYDWNLYGMLLIGLPLEDNVSYKIPFWNQQTKTEETLTATLEGREEVESLSGITYNTHKVVTDQGLTFWLVKEKPYVIQLELALPNGSTMIWEMM